MLLTIAIALNVVALLLFGLTLWVGQDNHKAPTIAGGRSPLSRQTVDALQNNGLFRFFDRIPLFRRSGKATVNDLAKALVIMLIISAAPGLIGTHLPLWGILFVTAFLMIVVDAILFMHPALSHRQSFADNARGRSPFAGRNQSGQ